jgi:hypothetical protein
MRKPSTKIYIKNFLVLRRLVQILGVEGGGGGGGGGGDWLVKEEEEE